jgi:transcriptional regulator of arginine metabolism
MKTKRHKAILDIIENQEICTQEGLLEQLKQLGFDVTQATVSRDIKMLDLVKTMTENGKYRYTQRLDYIAKKNSAKFKSVFIEATLSVDYALNTVVIKCHVGMANAACAALDTMHFDDVVGTLAGDDTIFVLMRSEPAAKKLVDKILEMLER